MKNILMMILCLTVLAGCAPKKKSQDASLPAKISFMTGDVKVSRDGVAQPASLDMILSQDDVVMTGVDGKANILFSDVGISRVGPNTVVAIIRLMRTESGDNIGMEMEKGYVLSSLKKLTRESDTFNISTPTAVVGVRGTTFIVKVDPEMGMKAECFAGKVVLQDKQNVDKKLEVNASEGAVLPGNDFQKGFVEPLSSAAQEQVKDLDGATELTNADMIKVREEIASVTGTKLAEEKKVEKPKPIAQTKPKVVAPPPAPPPAPIVEETKQEAPPPVQETNSTRTRSKANW